MKLLRTRSVPSSATKPSSTMLSGNDVMEPVTPARTQESEPYSSPPRGEADDHLSGSIPVSRATTRRRSLRLSGLSDSHECKGVVDLEPDNGFRVSSNVLNQSASNVMGNGSEKGGNSMKRRLRIDDDNDNMANAVNKMFLSLRSGKRVLKRLENGVLVSESITKNDVIENVTAVSEDSAPRARPRSLENDVTREQLVVNGNGGSDESVVESEDTGVQAEAKKSELTAERIDKKGERVAFGAIRGGPSCKNLDMDEIVTTADRRREYESDVKGLVDGAKGKMANKWRGKLSQKGGVLPSNTSDANGNHDRNRKNLKVKEKRLFESKDSNISDNVKGLAVKREKRKRNMEDLNLQKEKPDQGGTIFLTDKLDFEFDMSKFEETCSANHEEAPCDIMNSRNAGEASSLMGMGRLNREDKGKALLMEGTSMLNSDEVEKSAVRVINNLSLEAEGNTNAGEQVPKLVSENQKVNKESGNETRMDHFHEIARKNASRFAHHEAWLEGDEDSEVEHDVLDWPGPFTTAMKIIQDRKDRKNLHTDTSKSNRTEVVQLTWVPRRDQPIDAPKRIVPSLQDLCLKVLVQNSDAITSLEYVADSLKHKLCHMLCHSRRMDSHILDLLFCGSPTEIRLPDCSWLTEEQFVESFKRCTTSNLTVLQLDLCGRCLPDYVVLSTLDSSSNSLPVLSSLSLTGACRLSDVGLQAFASSAPTLRSINLSQCSLLTSTSIDTLADTLGSVLKELYINDCQCIDAMHILSALQKFESLEVLSLAGIHNVKDKFIREFVTVRGHNVKELILSDCGKLTDSSFKFISENCPALHTLDISNLTKLTDAALGFLSNGCRSLQNLKLHRNVFSDEAIAAFVETSGDLLRSLSLNNVKKVNHNTALSLSQRKSKLQSLDLSWCRNLRDEAVGLIVDNCASLRVLKLFGCTQITNAFLHGHSNPNVQIIGLKMTPILDDLGASYCR